jgi:signal peptidase I
MAKWRKYSYVAQIQQRHRFLWVFFWLGVVCLVYWVLSAFVLSAVALENETMLPGCRPGDRFIVISQALYKMPLPGKDPEALPYERGNIVLIDESLGEKHGFFLRTMDYFARFFTAQRRRAGNAWGRAYIKRVAALPGDEISMTNFILEVKPLGQPYSLTEYEMSGQSYDLQIPQTSPLWDESLPFSNSMENRRLGNGEYFVLSDNRANTNDSRTWGPVRENIIAGRLVFRYWPLSRIGLM